MSARNHSKLSRGNSHLNEAENYAVFELIGGNCQSQCTTIAQLFEANNTRWVKKCSGILCFIKDMSKRSYFMRMYCLLLHKTLWEQEIYNELKIDKVRPFLLEFEGQHGMIALNFCFEDEASEFMNVVMATVTNRNKRREERKKLGEKNPQISRPLPEIPNEDEKVPLNYYESLSYHQKKTKKKRITKNDIGAPRDFRHECHIGFDGSKFGTSDEIKLFLNKAGVTDKELRNQKTKNVVEKFIRKNNVQEVVYRESMQVTRAAPPPPIPATPPPELPNRSQKLRTVNMTNRPVPPIPTAVMPSKYVTSNAPPPPPPPPLLSAAPPPPPPMTTEKLSTDSSPRQDLFDIIRGGITLKKVNSEEVPEKNKAEEVGSDALAKALLEVLNKRRMRMGSDTEDDSDLTEDDLDEEDWE